MARSIFILIVAIAVASFFTQPAVGQFTFPKIKLPKILKKDTPTTTNSPDPVSSTSDSSSSVPAGDVRGKPIAGAKLTFSNNPDGSNPKTNFTSSEYIYGRLDTGGRTIYDAFGWKAMGDRKFYYVSYFLKIRPAGDGEGWEHDWHNGRGYTLVTKEEAQKTYWNFDVLPDPLKASTLSSAIADELEFYKGISGIYSQWYDADSARFIFPKSGTYNADITLYGDSYDDWGKSSGNYETYPTVSATLPFQFSGSDGQTLIANGVKARESIDSAKNRREMFHAMPDWWFKGGTYPAEPNLAAARLVPMIKAFIAEWNLTYLKHMIVKTDGPLRTITKNDFGLPTYKDLSPYIYIIYKDPKDNSCQLGALYMRQAYAGAGTYGEPFLGGIRDVKYIDCSVVK